jgi:hypothetical protein
MWGDILSTPFSLYTNWKTESHQTTGGTKLKRSLLERD